MSKSRPIKAILFDADGTLIDTAPSIAATINHLCSLHQREPIDTEALKPIVSLGGRAMLKLAFDIKNKQQEDDLFNQLIEHYPNFITHELRVFDGYYEALRHLEQNGIAWGVVSNKPERFLHPQLQHVELDQRSQVTIGGDTYKNKKPHPQQLQEACRQLGISPREAIYVGDCENDVIAAKRADMQAWVVEFGYIPNDGSHHHWGADKIIIEPSNLSL